MSECSHEVVVCDRRSEVQGKPQTKVSGQILSCKFPYIWPLILN